MPSAARQFLRIAVSAALIAALACTPSLVPIQVSPPELNASTAPMQVQIAGLEKAQLTRGAVAEGALGTKWTIDARHAVTVAAQTVFPATSGPTLTLTLRDFDVDWTTRQNAGVAEITFRSVVQFDYAVQRDGTPQTGSVVGRGRHVDTGWGPKLDQRIGKNVDAVVRDAIHNAFVDLTMTIDGQ